MTFDILLKRAMLLRQDLGRSSDESIRYRHQRIAATAAQLYFAHGKCGSPGFSRITSSGRPPLDGLTEDLLEMGKRYLRYWESLVDRHSPFHDRRQISILRNDGPPYTTEPWNGPSKSESGREKGDVIGYGTEILPATLEDELDNTICTLEVLAKLGAPDLRLSPTLAFAPQKGTDPGPGEQQREPAAEGRQGVRVDEGASVSAKGWTPPLGYVGVKTICFDERFHKNGKNPPRTTIHAWIKRSQRTGEPVDVVKAPDSQEVHVPEDWVVDQVRTWNPRAD